MVVFGSAERLETELRESGGKAASAQITATQKGQFAISTAMTLLSRRRARTSTGR